MTSPTAAIAFLKSRGKHVLTFLGYSTAGYEDPVAMLEAAAGVLRDADPDRTLVNSGATPMGIGAVYPLAHRMGFETAGIVSRLARERGVAPSAGVDHVMFIDDDRWGGWDDERGALSPTSQAMVGASDEVVCIGGGRVARDELAAAREAGIPWRFIAADFDHDRSRTQALERGDPPPGDFRGAVHARFGLR